MSQHGKYNCKLRGEMRDERALSWLIIKSLFSGVRFFSHKKHFIDLDSARKKIISRLIGNRNKRVLVR